MDDRGQPLGLIGWLLAAYIFCLPIQFQSGIGFRLAPSDLCLLFMLLCGISKLKLRRTTWSIWHFGIVITFAIGTYVALIHNGTLSRYELVQKDIGLLALFLGYAVVTTHIDSWAKLRMVMKLFLVSVALQNAFVLGVYVSGVDVAWMNTFHPRVSGMLVDPNAYGGLLVVAFAFHILTFYNQRPLIPGYWGMFTTITLAIGILLTYSRSAWIGMVLVLLVVLVIRPVYAWRMLLVFVTAVGLVVTVFGKNNLEVIVNLARRPDQIAARIDILRDAVAMFAEKPLFGVGLGTFAEQENVIIHNSPAWFLTEFGLFGFVMFIGFMSWFLLVGISVYQKLDASDKPLILALLLAHVAMLGLSLGIEAFYQRHWWLVFALIASPLTILRESEKTTIRVRSVSNELYRYSL